MEKLVKIDQDKFSVPAKLFIGTLPVEQDLDTVLLCQAGDAVLCIGTAAAYGLLLVPEPRVHFISQPLAAGKHMMVLSLRLVRHRSYVGPLVQSRIFKARTEGMLPILLPGAASSQLLARHTDDG